MQTLANTSARAAAFLVVTMFLWAGNHIVGKWAVGNIPPMTLAFFRWSVAALLILPFAWADVQRDWPTIRANAGRMLLLGFLGSGIYNTLQYLALTGTTVTNAAILNSWAPVLIAAAGAAIFHDRLRPIQIAGLFCSLFGVAVIVLHGDFATLASLAVNHGDIVMLLATGIWAAYTTLLRLRPQITTLSFAAITYTIASFVNLPLATFEYAQGQHVVWSWSTAAAIVYTGALASCLAYYLYARGVELIGPTRAGAFIHLIPMFATAQAILLLGEAPYLYHAIGFGLILCGVALASRAQAPSPSN